MLRIAIIDSGIAEGILPNKIISQHRIYNGEIFDEKPVDYVGHGTAIASILCKTALFEMLSICPGINNEGIPDRIVSSIDMYTAIKLAIELQADIINICMGTTVFSDKNKIQQICETGYKKGILIVCAESTEGIPTMPWSCQGVVRVKAKTGNTYSITISENDKIPSIEVAGNIYRIKTKEGRNFFGSGNSYATPYFINCLINSFDCNSPNIDFREKINSFFRTSENDLYEFLTGTKIENIDQNIDFVYTDIPAIGKVVLIPFSKEMHVLIRNSDKLGCKVVGVVDPVKNTNIGKDPGELLGLSSLNIKITNSLDKVENNAERLIIGYTDEIQKYDKYFSLDNILAENINCSKLDVFTFIPPDKKWIDSYKKEGIRLEYPTLINKDNYEKLVKAVPTKTPVYKPVIGVFGTSSSQGKVTMQLNIKNAFEERGIKPFYISTENHGSLLGAGFTFATGYGNDKIISISSDRIIHFLNCVMSYADNIPGYDLFLMGNQSWLVPFSKEQTFFRSAVLLEGIKPDIAVLVVNPLIDPYEYIFDTIGVLKGIYKCIVIALAFSNSTPCYNKYGAIYKKKLDEYEIEQLSKKLEEIFEIPAGFIGDNTFINKIIDNIIELCK